MSGPSITARQLLSQIIVGASAESVFDQSAPFFSAYKLGYLDALMKEDTRVLDVHREAIFYLRPAWESSMILALILVASRNSNANFVESLAFYFSLDGKSDKFISDVTRGMPEILSLLVSSLSELEANLRQSTDDDMADVFSSVRGLVKSH